MLTGRKYRLALTPEQEAMCEEFGNICRAVWNTALEQRREYARRGAWISMRQQSVEFTQARVEHEWLQTAPRSVTQEVLRDIDKLCARYGTFRMHWRTKARWSPSFRFSKGYKIKVERLGRKWGRVRLERLGWVKFRWSRPPGGEIRSATVSRRAGHWYISILVEDSILTPEHHAGTPIGIDRGVAVAAVTSAGDFYDRKFSTDGENARYLRLQKRLSRQRKGSANRRKTLAAMKRAMGRVIARRTDFAAITASRITERHSMVILEDLKTKSMTTSAKGTADKPGKMVRQKAGLNRAILDKGWRRLEVALRSAARYTGTVLVLVDPAYTSQTCNRCKHVDSKSRKSQAIFVCTSCRHRDHADVNAAKNILSAAGHAVPACGDLGVARSMKQEPAAPRGVPRQLALPLAEIFRQ